MPRNRLKQTGGLLQQKDAVLPVNELTAVNIVPTEKMICLFKLAPLWKQNRWGKKIFFVN